VLPVPVTLLRLPLGCLTWSILRLTILAAVLVGGYFLVAKPLIDRADKAGHGATHRVDRVKRCLEHSDGNAHRLLRCSAKF
jgi:hypothetical protein